MPEHTGTRHNRCTTEAASRGGIPRHFLRHPLPPASAPASSHPPPARPPRLRSAQKFHPPCDLGQGREIDARKAGRKGVRKGTRNVSTQTRQRRERRVSGGDIVREKKRTHCCIAVHLPHRFGMIGRLCHAKQLAPSLPLLSSLLAGQSAQTNHEETSTTSHFSIQVKALLFMTYPINITRQSPTAGGRKQRLGLHVQFRTSEFPLCDVISSDGLRGNI